MTNIFITVINMSLAASFVALLILALNRPLKRLPRFVSVILWAFVAIRLILPFSLESDFSLIPSGETVPQNITGTAVPQINSNLPFIDSAVDGMLADNFANGEAGSQNPIIELLDTAGIIWIIGAALMLCYFFASNIYIKRRLRESIPLYTKKERIYICDRIPSPFIFGILRPKIYMPSCISESDAACVIAHEQAHIARKDYIWKPLAFLILSVYWFNPVLWAAYIFFCRDIELATDERVLKSKGEEIKIQYSKALLNCSGDRRFITACPTAFGENAVKDRIKNVLNYKKPTFWVVVVSVIAVCTVPIFLLTNPKKEEAPIPTEAKDGEIFLDAIVTDVDEGYMYVRDIGYIPINDPVENHDGIFAISLKSNINLPEIKIGCMLRIVHKGETDSGKYPSLVSVISVHLLGNPPENHSPISDFEYHNNYYGGKTIIAYNGNDENVIIPTVIDGKPVSAIGGNAFKNKLNLKSVYIPDTVYTIAGGLFEDCLNLESVRLPIALYAINDRAFANCKSLKEITLPSTLQRIGTSAFEKCYGLKYVEIPKSITYWGGRSFAQSGLKEVVFEEGLAKIGSSDFQKCLWLEKVTIPEGTEWSYGCFYGCGALPKEYRESQENE